MSSLLPWLLGALVLAAAPILLYRYADDHPRRDDPDDPGEGPLAVRMAA